jgi:hypothetical protein
MISATRTTISQKIAEINTARLRDAATPKEWILGTCIYDPVVQQKIIEQAFLHCPIIEPGERATVGKIAAEIKKSKSESEFDLHIWRFGLGVTEPTDFGLFAGLLDLQIETNRGYASGFPPGVPIVRLLFPPDRSVQPWPLRCDCDPSGDNVDSV